MRYLLIYGVIVISISVNGTLALICHCTERFSNYDGYGEVVPCINNTCEVGKRG
uniref:Late nodulin n=2 Tax=Bursaphelenchus xylophilus TaxID=6326 RepID=A0A1I7SKB3_BURXY